MNRGGSSDSLDNAIGEIVSSGSSSPTDFTSDDETSADNIFMMSGQPLQNKSRSRTNKSSIVDKFPMSRHRNEYDQVRGNVIQSTARRPILGANNQNLTSQRGSSNFDQSIASTSYYDPSGSNIDLVSTRIPDIIPDTTSLSLMRGNQDFGHTSDSRFGTRDLYRAPFTGRRDWPQHGGHSSNSGVVDENDKNFNSGLIHDDEDSYAPRLDNRIELSLQAISEPARSMSTIAVRMCARLVEYRSLHDAIEFIDQNRDLIDSLTRVVTRDAPAFRNYDMTNYQTDYSVKESFNPNFWSDREPVVTTADGNCQYHAVSLSLTGSEAYTQEVRLATAVAVVDNREWFDSMLRLIDRGTVLDLVHTIARSYSWGDETTLKAIAVAIKRRIFLYTCNMGKKDYELVKLLSKEELLDAFKEKKYRGGTGIHTYADPLCHVSASNYIMLFHKSEHFIAVLPTSQQPTMFEPYNPIVPVSG